MCIENTPAPCPDDLSRVAPSPSSRRPKTVRSIAARLIAAIALMAIPAGAQWTTQPIVLQPGWNSIFLEVQPEPRACDDVFAGMPVESVWLGNRHFSSVEFIQDPAALLPKDPDWLVWFPAQSPGRPALNLHSLLGGRAYLIKLADGASPTVWNVRGTPSLRPIDWRADSLSFVGFAVSSQNPPTFASHFAGVSAHDGEPIYQLNASGHWSLVSNPAGATLERGVAYWVKSRGPSTFSAPVALELEQGNGLDFGRTLVEQTIRLQNVSSLPRSLTVRLLPSGPPPAGPYPSNAGGLSLEYFRMNLSGGQFGWVPLLGTLEKTDLAPGAQWTLRLQVRRANLAPTTDPDAVYQSLLEIADDYGTRLLVPVTAQTAQSAAAATAGSATGSSSPPTLPDRHAGLWLGNANITRVSQPGHPSQPDTPQPVPAEFSFRLIVHVDAGGQPRLLQKVTQLWKNGTTRPDPIDPASQIVDVPGRFVLLTDDALIPNYSGAALRDGVPVGRRVSSTAFGFKEPVDLAGSGDFGLNTLSAQIVTPHHDPLNPFVHRFHPDHNNLDERFEQALPSGVESFTITRQLSLAFSAQPPDGIELAGWGDTQLGGTYRETIRGVHQRPIYLEGYFRLQRASTVASLNDQN